MQRSSSRPEQAPTKKNKLQSQREYRSKEIDGFFELRSALLLADPFDTPLGRDATRPQLLVAAAKKLRNLAEENQKLTLQLTAMPELCQLETKSEMPMTAQNPVVSDVAWATHAYSTEHLLSSDLVTQLGDFQTTQSLHPFYAQQYDIPSEPQYH